MKKFYLLVFVLGFLSFELGAASPKEYAKVLSVHVEAIKTKSYILRIVIRNPCADSIQIPYNDMPFGVEQTFVYAIKGLGKNDPIIQKNQWLVGDKPGVQVIPSKGEVEYLIDIESECPRFVKGQDNLLFWHCKQPFYYPLSGEQRVQFAPNAGIEYLPAAKEK